MAELVRMPEVLTGATEAAIQTWLVGVGDSVALEQPLAEVETEKATVELTAESAGTVGRLLVSEGRSVAVGDAILVLLAAGEGDEALEKAMVGAAAAEAPEVSTPSSSAPVLPAPTLPAMSAGEGTSTSAIEAGGRIFASPLVRKLAAQNGVALSELVGTGPQGRIVRRDLERHLQASADVARTSVAVPPQRAHEVTFEDVPLDRMRKAIARRLTESKSTVPHFYLRADCRVDALLKLRSEINASVSRKISVNDFVLKAVASALIAVPAANVIWNGDSIRQFSTVDISVAVATEGGLTTPVLRAVERMPLSEVSATLAELAQRARAGKLKQHELEGGSFSVSNLGMYGTTEFSAILNPPQSGILAIGMARAMPVVDANQQLTVGQVMTVTLSADHRVLDGAIAAKWLSAFQQRIENPLAMLV